MLPHKERCDLKSSLLISQKILYLVEGNKKRHVIAEVQSARKLKSIKHEH